jgi:hypothetical protein
MAPAEPRNRKNGVWKLKDDEKNLQQCGGESNPEKQPALAVGKQSNGKSRLKCKFD